VSTLDRKVIHEIAQQVASKLSLATQSVWAYQPPDDPTWSGNWAEIVGPAGYNFTLGWSDHRGERISITGHYPRSKNAYYSPRDCVPYDQRDSYKTPDITVAANRGIDVLVKEINRRFLPDYRAAYAMVAKRVAQADDYAQAKLDTIHKVAQGIGCNLEREHDGEVKPALYPHIDGVYQLRIEKDSVTIERLNLNADLAIDVLNLIKIRTAQKKAA
jgi:hypothetical protein